jgi:hypothetical protein
MHAEVGPREKQFSADSRARVSISIRPWYKIEVS